MSRSDLLKELRALTQAGMKDCSDALNEAGDDLQKAVDIIKTKGKNIVSSRQGKIASEGFLSYCFQIDGNITSLVEVNCQTDFVAKSEGFKQFAADVSAAIYEDTLADKPFDINNHAHLVSARDNLIATTKENVVVRRWWVEQAMSPLTRVFHYVHSNSQIGVLLTLLAPPFERNSQEFIDLGNDLAMQVAAMNPLAISPDTLPPEEVARQSAIFLTQLQELNKPPAAQAKIMEGKLNKWYSEVCLLEQESVVVPKTPIKKVLADLGAKLGGEIKVINMIRCQVGEGIEQQTTNLADEVAKLMQ